MKAKTIKTAVMAVALVAAFGLAAYAMGPGHHSATRDSSTSGMHHSGTGACPYMGSHTGSHMDHGRQMGNHMGAEDTDMMGEHLRSGAGMMHPDHTAEPVHGPHHVR